MEFCLSIEIQEGMTYADTLAMTRAGEDAGFQSSLLAEHYEPSSGIMDRMSADAWVFLGGLARDTQRIRLGSLVSPVAFRHPSVLAKMAATLDHMTEGRAELGVGAGWLESEHDAYGFPFGPPAERVDLVEEQLQIIKGLWTEDPFSFHGTHYHLQNCHFTPTPVQRPHMRNTDTWIIGTPAPAAEQVKQFEAAGVNRLMFSVENDLHREMIPVLGEVLPLVR